jgi:myosin heavy subunit
VSKDQEGIEQLLSPEELAAINGDDDEAGELDGIIGEAGDDEAGDEANDAEGADEGEDEGEGHGEDEGGDGNAAAADDSQAAAAAEEGDDGVVSEFVPQTEAQPVENFDQRMQEFADKKAELRRKLSDGDIDIEQYEAQKDQLVDQETELKLAQRDYENAIKREQQTARQKWEWEQEQFFDSEANQVYKDKGVRGTAMNAALDRAVRELAQDPANAKRSGSWFLQEADRQVREAMGLTKPPKQQERQTRRADLSDIPKTLGNLPAAEQTETGDSEFGYLDKLEGVDLERELAKISRDPVREARYLRSL